MKPEVSVIVTTYNRVNFLLERSLPSALKQTYKNFECIVVDDGSTDRTGEAVKAFQAKDSRIKYIKLPQNRGVSAARNAGVKAAAGEYIAFLDDDDELLPDFLEETLSALKGLSVDFGGVGVDRIHINNGNRIYLSVVLSKGFYHAISVGWLLRKGVFDKVRYDEKLRSDTDADFGIQFFSFFKAKAVNRPLLLTYGHQEDEFGVSLPSEQRITALDRFLEKNLPLFKANSKTYRKDLEFIYRFAGQDYCRGGKMRKGITFLWKALLVNPGPRNLFNFLAALLGFRFFRFYWRTEKKLIDFIMKHQLYNRI